MTSAQLAKVDDAVVVDVERKKQVASLNDLALFTKLELSSNIRSLNHSRSQYPSRASAGGSAPARQEQVCRAHSCAGHAPAAAGSRGASSLDQQLCEAISALQHSNTHTGSTGATGRSGVVLHRRRPRLPERAIRDRARQPTHAHHTHHHICGRCIEAGCAGADQERACCSTHRHICTGAPQHTRNTWLFSSFLSLSSRNSTRHHSTHIPAPAFHHCCCAGRAHACSHLRVSAQILLPPCIHVVDLARLARAHRQASRRPVSLPSLALRRTQPRPRRAAALCHQVPCDGACHADPLYVLLRRMRVQPSFHAYFQPLPQSPSLRQPAPTVLTSSSTRPRAQLSAPRVCIISYSSILLRIEYFCFLFTAAVDSAVKPAVTACPVAEHTKPKDAGVLCVRVYLFPQVLTLKLHSVCSVRLRCVLQPQDRREEEDQQLPCVQQREPV
jgi:hypothetical protein